MHYADSYRTFAKFSAREGLFTQNPYDVSSIYREAIPRKSDLGPILDKFRPNLAQFEEIYRNTHQDQELLLQESSTTQIAAQLIKDTGYEVTENEEVDGLIGLLNNGPGRTVLLRADMEVLPMKTKSGLDYASQNMVEDVDGGNKSVTHACGHGMHVAVLLSAATLLYDARSEWSGTLIILVQPNEELNRGTTAMVGDKWYEHIVPAPDVIVGQHVALRTGVVTIRTGPVLAGVDSFNVTVFGKGGPAETPQHGIDPVLIVGHIIVRLQSTIAREIAPTDVAVITYASIDGGSASNSISDHVDFKLNVRTENLAVRSKVLKAIKRIINAEAEAAGVDKLPIVKQYKRAPIPVIDPDTTEVLTRSFQHHFGGNTWGMEPDNAIDEFDDLVSLHHIPYLCLNSGGTEAEKWSEAEKEEKLLSKLKPENHSCFLTPVMEPALYTGTDAFAIAALIFLK